MDKFFIIMDWLFFVLWIVFLIILTIYFFRTALGKFKLWRRSNLNEPEHPGNAVYLRNKKKIDYLYLRACDRHQADLYLWLMMDRSQSKLKELEKSINKCGVCMFHQGKTKKWIWEDKK